MGEEIMQGWKAFRTKDGHTSNPHTQRLSRKSYTCNANVSERLHHTSLQFPLGTWVKSPDDNPLWFCETKADAIEWGLILGYRFIAQVQAIDAVYDPPYLSFVASQKPPPKFTAKKLMRVSETEGGSISSNNAFHTATAYLDAEDMADLLKLYFGTNELSRGNSEIQRFIIMAFQRNRIEAVHELAQHLGKQQLADRIPVAWLLTTMNNQASSHRSKHGVPFMEELWQQYQHLSPETWAIDVKEKFYDAARAGLLDAVVWIFDHWITKMPRGGDEEQELRKMMKHVLQAFADHFRLDKDEMTQNHFMFEETGDWIATAADLHDEWAQVKSCRPQ